MKQIFWVTPCLFPSRTFPASSALERYEMLSKVSHFVGLIHGKLSHEEKDRIINQFAAGDIRILVSTTVIEVGIDIPDASMVVIERAENFGLSQLHQLRGRIGRGAPNSVEKLSECYCILLHSEEDNCSEKLNILLTSNNGFDIAEADLSLRGPGDIFGSKQHGDGSFK
jgi:ATP-dependent DNA helicase RecG